MLGRITRRGFDLQSLEVFVMVCETGSMTDAGAILGLTQSAVSQVVKNLEEALGVTLFDRKLRPVVVTTVGNVLRRRAHLMLQEADQIMGSVRDLGTTVMPYFRLGIVTSVAVSVGPKLVPSIYDKAAEISIFSGAAPVLRTALIRREADIIITTDDPDGFENVDIRRLLQEPYLVVMSKRSAERYGNCSIQDLAQALPLIRYSAFTSAGSQIDRHLRRIRLETTSNLELDTAEGIIAMVLNDLGWTITTPLALMRSSANAADLHVSIFPAPGFSRTLNLISRRGELMALPAEIAARCQELLHQDVLPTLEKRFPGFAQQMLIG